MDHVIFNFPAVRFANDFEPDPCGAADTLGVAQKPALRPKISRDKKLWSKTQMEVAKG